MNGGFLEVVNFTNLVKIADNFFQAFFSEFIDILENLQIFVKFFIFA